MLLLLVLCLNNAFERYSAAAQAMALGNAVTASTRGVNAIRSNPAALDYLDKNEFLCGYEYSFSGLEGLHNIAVGFARPIFGGGFGLYLSEFGFSEQKEQAITCTFGTGLTKDFKFGIGNDIYIINNKRTGKGFAYGLNIAFLGRLYKRWSLGVYCHNLNQPQFSSTEESNLPRELKVGLGYEAFDDIVSEIDISMIEDNLRTHLACEFKLFDVLCFRTGVITNPSVISAGVGIVYKFINIDYAIEHIPELPLTHNMTLRFEF